MTRNPGTPSPRNRSVTASIPHYLFYLNNSSGREGGVDRGCSQQEKAARRIRPARPADLQNNLQGGACTNMKILQSDRIRVYLGTSAFKPIALTGLTRIVPPRFRISMAASVHRTGSPRRRPSCLALLVAIPGMKLDWKIQGRLEIERERGK